MNKDEFIRMQQAATNRVREMQKKAMQNNEKHDKNTNTQKDIQNNKKATIRTESANYLMQCVISKLRFIPLS